MRTIDVGEKNGRHVGLQVGLQEGLLAVLHSRTRRRGAFRTLIVPASTFGSLGDLAMIEGLHVLLRAERAETAGSKTQPSLARYGQSDHWRTSFAFDDTMIVPNGLRGWLRWVKDLSEVNRLFLNGADVLDGKYSPARSLKRLSIVKHAARRGIPCTITGFSFNDSVPGAIVDAFNDIPTSVRFCLRDPDSLQRFNDRTRHSGVQVADLAFMLSPTDVSEDPMVRRMKASAADGRYVVALAPNLHCVSISGSPAEKRRVCMDFFVRVAGELADRGCLIVLFPHDARGENSDQVLCEQLAFELAASGIETLMIPPPPDPAYVKGIVGHCDLVISGRMHCGIAALGAGTPVVLIDYQDKVKGLEQFFDMKLSVKLASEVEVAVSETLRMVDAIRAEVPPRRQAVLRGAARAVALARANLMAG